MLALHSILLKLIQVVLTPYEVIWLAFKMFDYNVLCEKFGTLIQVSVEMLYTTTSLRRCVFKAVF